MLRIGGLVLAFATVLLQISVFLQPLLPEQYQIAPVCEKLTHELFFSNKHQDKDQHSHHHSVVVETTNHQHHDLNHQCQYCVVYGNLVIPPEIGIKEVLVRIQIRLVAFARNYLHVYYALQRLYLLPQGRAPPFSSI